jgi:hypothetical protein
VIARERIWPAGLGLIAATTALLALARPSPPSRVAIRVSCDEPRACERAESLALDVWSEDRGPGLPLDVVIASDRLAELGFPYEILDPDIDATARAEQVRLHQPLAARPEDWFAEYHDYRAVTERIHALAALAPDRAAVQPIGSSIDGRTIWALHVGRGGTPMLINGTQHAREWISTMVTTCVADRLVRDYDRDPAIKDFVDHTDLWVVPVVNPDGYQHTWAGDRYWRKNRRDRHGVDLNRNFAIAWGGDGSSSRKSSEIYRGEYAFSEPETAALRDLAKRIRPASHVDFHAYGQLVLFPWGYTSTRSKDDARFAAVGDRIASAIFAAHQTRYSLMRSVQLYPASGTMTDWMYGDTGALSYTIELRPKGRSGFVLPPEEIRPTCDEGLAAVLALRAATSL